MAPTCPVPSPATLVPNLPTAVRITRTITAYERFRLELYRARSGNPDRIELQSFGAALALRFPAVGYFNQVQGLTASDLDHLPALAAFYAGLPGGFKVQTAPDTDRAAVFARLEAEGFRPCSTAVRLARPLTTTSSVLPPAPRQPGLTIAPLREDEIDEFFLTYLEAFGAARTGWPAALPNLRLLAGRPGLHCLFARQDGRPAGLGMVFVMEGVAYFCAGAVLPAFRTTGLQTALIEERLRVAAESGCDLAASWTEEASASHRNLARAGFETSYLDPIWRSPPVESAVDSAPRLQTHHA